MEHAQSIALENWDATRVGMCLTMLWPELTVPVKGALPAIDPVCRRCESMNHFKHYFKYSMRGIVLQLMYQDAEGPHDYLVRVAVVHRVAVVRRQLVHALHTVIRGNVPGLIHLPIILIACIHNCMHCMRWKLDRKHPRA